MMTGKHMLATKAKKVGNKKHMKKMLVSTNTKAGKKSRRKKY